MGVTRQRNTPKSLDIYQITAAGVFFPAMTTTHFFLNCQHLTHFHRARHKLPFCCFVCTLNAFKEIVSYPYRSVVLYLHTVNAILISQVRDIKVAV